MGKNTGAWIHTAADGTRYVNIMICGLRLNVGAFADQRKAARRFFEAVEFLRENEAFLGEFRKKI